MSHTSTIKPSIFVLLFAVIFSLSTHEYRQTWKKGQGCYYKSLSEVDYAEALKGPEEKTIKHCTRTV